MESKLNTFFLLNPHNIKYCFILFVSFQLINPVFHISFSKSNLPKDDALNVWFILQQKSKNFKGTFNSTNIYETISLFDSLSELKIEVSEDRSFGRMLYDIEQSLLLDDILIEKISKSGDEFLLISALEFKFRTLIAAQRSFNNIFRRMPNDSRLANLVLFTTCNYECTGIKTKILKYLLDELANSGSKEKKIRGWKAVERMLSEIDFKKSETNLHGIQASTYGIFFKPSDVMKYLTKLSENEFDTKIKLLSEQSLLKITLKGNKEKNLEGENELIQIHLEDEKKVKRAAFISELLQKAHSAETEKEKILLYTKVISTDSTVFTAYINRGVSYYKINEMENALLDFNTSLKFNNETGIPFAYKGIILLKSNDWQNAVNNFNTAIELDPYLHIAYTYRGIIFQQNNEYNSAINDFTVAIEIDSSVVSNYINRGVCYANLQKLIEAEIDLKEAIKRAPESAEAFYNLGTVNYLQKNWSNAIVNWQKCIELDNRFKDVPEKLEHVKRRMKE